MLTEKPQDEILCLIKDTLTERKPTYFSPSFDGTKQFKKNLFSLGEDSSTLGNAYVIRRYGVS